MSSLLAFIRSNALWLGAGMLLTFLSSFGQTFFISVFAGNIRADFGLSHGAWGGLYAAATMASAVVMVFAGTLTDRIRVRNLGPIVIVGLSAAALAMAMASSLWMLALAVFFLRLFGQGLMSHTAMVAMSRWFIATRGRAIGIAGLGISLGESLLPLSFVALLGFVAWRNLWISSALVLLCLAPVLFVLLRNERTPQSFTADEGSQGMQGRNWTRLEALRHPFYWLMVPALIGPPAWGTAFFFHQVHLAEVKDWSHAVLVALFPVFTVSAVVFLQVAGWMVDRFGSARLMPVYLLPNAAGFIIFALAPSPWTGALGMICMGASAGMNNTLGTTIWAEAYGTRNLGSIRAMMAAVSVLGSAIGPGLTGVIIDQGIDFARQGWAIALYFALASLLAALAARFLLRDAKAEGGG
ncbi:MFS transporter [Pararhodobacter oceanensis]|uniref:MFS transporter n=1 Tax=Pararhodobacter oceanensis TaxID=2172121 RepID=UPI003A9177AA